jgi:RNA polymerase sigma-70 factor, ECF subfamily
MEDQRFEQLWLKNSQSLYHYAYRKVGNGPDAEDLVSDTFIRCWKSRQTFQVGRSFYKWASWILHNIWVDNIRLLYSRPTINLPQTTWDVVIDQREGPEELSLKNLYSEKTEGALKTLWPDYRQSLELRMTGLEYQAIADIIHVPVGTIRSRIHRARRSLKKALV